MDLSFDTMKRLARSATCSPHVSPVEYSRMRWYSSDTEHQWNVSRNDCKHTSGYRLEQLPHTNNM